MAEILTPEPPLNYLTDQFLEECLHEADTTFANGNQANNHINGSFEEVPPKLAELVTSELIGLTRPYVDTSCFIAPVPSGANGWAQSYVEQLGDTHMTIIKSKKVARREFSIDDSTREQIGTLLLKNRNARGIVIDDVTSDGGTNEAMADFLTQEGLEVQLVVSLFYRGNLRLLQSKYKRAALMTKFIPPIIDQKTYKQNMLRANTT